MGDSAIAERHDDETLDAAGLYEKGEDCYWENDYTGALKWFMKAAEQGHAAAQKRLGDMYFKGKGVREDYYKSMGWYQKSADQGNADAQYSLGKLYATGQRIFRRHSCYGRVTNTEKFVNKNYSEALKWYRKAAAHGNAEADKELGDMFEWGIGVVRDIAESAKWYRAAAELGDAESQKKLGDIYSGDCFGESAAVKDLAEATRWYRRAAENGDSEAQKKLGDMCYCGNGVTQDYSEAAKWYLKAAMRVDELFDSCDMFFYLCSMYFHGCGLCRDYNEAYKWFAALCKSSSSLSMYRGLIDEIVGWFRKAAEQGDSIAQKILGDIYYGGKGVPQNYSLAAQFYREAGDQGDMHSQKKLADMYRFGNGVGRDCDEALK